MKEKQTIYKIFINDKLFFETTNKKLALKIWNRKENSVLKKETLEREAEEAE